MGWIDDLFGTAEEERKGTAYGGLFGKRAGKPLAYYADAQPFPTQDEARTARDVGFGREQPYQSMLRGEAAKQFSVPITDLEDWRQSTQNLADLPPRPVKDEKLRDAMMQAQLAANRSPLAALGYDPDRIVYDMQSKANTSLAGVYLPSRDATAINFAYGPSVAVHESVHRGVEKLSKREDFPKEMRDWLNRTVEYKAPVGISSGRTWRNWQPAI